jgi:selenide,water dikinase
LPPVTDPNVLVGIATSDDAGVYRLSEDLALVQTVDFFTPIVDDPYDFGRIAAANSLSDIYAMGAKPLTALNIATFPVDDLDLEILARILEGGAAVAKEAGIVILGGHTVKDPEPKYGMAVTGTIHPDKIVTNAAARPGDSLILTKPLGTGILSTALKRGLIDDAGIASAVGWMARLNAKASAAMISVGVHAATDVTGFGLLGHAGEMARGSGVRIELHASRVPFHDRALEWIEGGCIPGGTRDNAVEHAKFTEFDADVAESMRLGLSDADCSSPAVVTSQKIS